MASRLAVDSRGGCPGIFGVLGKIQLENRKKRLPIFGVLGKIQLENRKDALLASWKALRET
jgi:hypothetical protein